MLPDLSSLPTRQMEAVEALLGDDKYARTYQEASQIADMAESTLKTHLCRVKQNHPEVYQEIRIVREAQLAVRQRVAVENARQHSRQYFRKQNRYIKQLLGYGLWV